MELAWDLITDPASEFECCINSFDAWNLQNIEYGVEPTDSKLLLVVCRGAISGWLWDVGVGIKGLLCLCFGNEIEGDKVMPLCAATKDYMMYFSNSIRDFDYYVSPKMR